VSVQDAAAQLAARLVAPRSGERVLDACAAPGGKTGHLLELRPELAELVAVDVSSGRLARVAQNLERLGLQAKPEAELIVGDAAEPASWWDGRAFDRILLDVPCSATGVIRRHPDIKLLRRATDIAPLAARQAALLAALWPVLARGGRLVYASCSVLAAETTAVVEAFMAARAEARDVTADALAALGLTHGGGIGHRIATGTAGMDGFYYACLEKSKGL
jgi:16S rRNA (cytosine967-C5)-methyltransferase